MIYAQFPPPGSPLLEGLLDYSIYVRGAWTLHALRLQVGDECFFEILREYCRRFEYSNASTDDFVIISEEISEENLEELFSAWLLDDGVPPMPESFSASVTN